MDPQLHILYVVQYFNHPDDAGGSRAYQFAQQWAGRGHRVTVLTSNLNHKTLSETSKVPVGIDGVHVIRLRTYNRIRGSFRKRVLNFLSFAWQVGLRGLLVRRVDIVYASSTPLTTGLAGCLLAGLKRRPFYFEVRDLWPDSAVVAGVLTNRTLIRVIETLERLLYRRAAKVIALTEGIRDGVIHKGKSADDVLFVPNGVDDWMLEHRPGTPQHLPFDSSRHFICTYLGAHGRWNKVETILEAAAALRDTRIRFLLVGDGDYKRELMEYAERLRLDNVYFHAAVPKKQIFDYLSLAQVTLICTWDHAFHRMVLANKLFDYMAAGRPIVAAARGETADLITRADCGWTVEPERPNDLATLLVRLSGMPSDQLGRKGANGLAYVRQHYRRSELADRLQRTFLEVVTRSRPITESGRSKESYNHKSATPEL